MKKTGIARGVLPPLFDRIINDPMGMETPKQFLSPSDVKASILAELSLILNTRCTVRKVVYDNHSASIPLFGLPDFFGLEEFEGLDGANQQNWSKIARYIQTTIALGEPRLDGVHVKVKAYDAGRQMMSIEVEATVKQVPELKNIRFPLTLTYKGQ